MVQSGFRGLIRLFQQLNDGQMLGAGLFTLAAGHALRGVFLVFLTARHAPFQRLRAVEHQRLVPSMENIGNVEGAWNTDDRLRILLEILDFLPKSVEEIRTAYEKKTKAAVATPEILCMLMELCMEGTATQVSGNYFAAKVVTVSQQFCK